MYIGENIRKFRREKELTQETLAEFLGVTFQSVSKWERGESFPDITMLPAIASFFGVSTDELLGIDNSEKEKRIQHYIDEFNDLRTKNSPYVYEQMSRAIKEFPGDFRLIIRYLEMLLMTKSSADSDSELILDEVETIYGNILRYCINDTIRMRAKRLVCMYYNTLSHVTGKEKYTVKMREIAEEMPNILDSKDYILTIINLSDDEHFDSCRKALDSEMLLLVSTINNIVNYKNHFSAEYKIAAIKKCLDILNTFYDDGNYGSCWRSVIYILGDLGRLYCEIGDADTAVVYLEKCAREAVKHDRLAKETKHTSLLMEGAAYQKTKYGKTMCERMKDNFIFRYKFSSVFKDTDEFKKIIDIFR